MYQEMLLADSISVEYLDTPKMTALLFQRDIGKYHKKFDVVHLHL